VCNQAIGGFWGMAEKVAEREIEITDEN